jgi:amino acid adenylation domain-containing protein
MVYDRAGEAAFMVEPVSYAQQGLWFLDQLEPASPLYNEPLAFEIEGVLDARALEEALAGLVARHDALRTTFPSDGGTPVQRIARFQAAPLHFIDLREMPESDRRAGALELANETAWQPFDLAEGPLFRAQLLRMANDKHLLVLGLHHIITDGWSQEILKQDLWTLYRAALEGTSPALPALDERYADYVRRQREHLQGSRLERALTYWRSQLAGAPPFMDLPVDHPRPARPTYRGGTHSLTLSKGLTEGLHALARSERITLFIALLSAFQVLLVRYTRQTDVVVGAPIAGRLQSGLRWLVGFFVNTLPLRVDLSGDPTFQQLLTRVRDVALAAYEHQELPLERMVEDLQPPRTPGRTPVFQVLFALQNVPRLSFAVPGLLIQPVELERRTSRFDLAVSVTPASDHLKVAVEYSTDLFDAGTIVRIMDHYRVVLEAVVADPTCRISSLPLLTRAERHALLVERNDTARQQPPDRFDQLVQAHAIQTPDAIAIATRSDRITYRELDRRAGRLASHLRGLGVGPESVVAICLDRSVEMVIALLGILKAGAAYLPLDPATPAERLGFMLADAEPKVVVTRTSLVGQLPAHAALIVDLDADAGCIAAAPEACPEPDVSVDNLAYVIYTSGSTGRPKGVAVSHRGVANVYFALAESMGLGSRDQILQFSSLAFDFALSEVMMALCAGATLQLGSREELMPGEPLARFLAERRITVVDVTPSTLAVTPRTPLPHLRVLALGGEAFPVELARAWAGTPILLNLYGPTEATMISTGHRVERWGFPGLTIPIGRPLLNTRAYVLDRHMEPVPLNVPGELYLGGVGLARGYLRRPGLTAERFVPDPFADGGGGRLYRTGDLVRWLPDGTLEFLGRVDRQVKLRGFRIELDEIEGALLRHSDVRECVVIVREDDGPGQRLVAYLASRYGAAIVREELRRFLSASLPEYMIPQVFVVLPELPHMGGGKVDRKGLPAPASAGMATGDRIPPRSPVEEQLADVWRQVLGTADFGVEDDFFQVGGHSLLATQVIARVNATLQLQLPLITMFENPTIAGLAERMLREPASHSPLAASHRPARSGASV